MVRALVVDGDEGVREVERLLLEEAGYAVMEARTGAEALAILRRYPRPLVVLLDGRLPDGPGLRILHAAQQEHALRRHQYVYLPVLPQHRLTQATRDAVASLDAALIEKPFDIEAFIAVVDSVAVRLLPCVRAM